MAIVKYGSIVTELIGKFSGAVFQKANQTQIMRVQRSQNFAKSNSALLTQSNFAALVAVWQNLTQANRDTFANYAAQYPATDKFGNRVVMSGYNCFIAINRYLQNFSSTLVSTCAQFINLTYNGVYFSAINNTSAQFYLNFISPTPAGMRTLIYMSHPVGQNTNAFSAKYSYVYSFPANSSGVSNMYADYMLVIKEKCPPSKCVCVRVVQVEVNTGIYNWKLTTKVIPVN